MDHDLPHECLSALPAQDADPASLPCFRMGVVMERRPLPNNPWQQEQWSAVAIDPAAGEPGAPKLLLDTPERSHWLYPGFETRLYIDEAEGYFLNCSSARPVAFVAWRMEGGRAVPWQVTLSYNEAARALDSGENVDNVPLPEFLARTLHTYVLTHYKPEPKRRVRPPSFEGAKRDR